MKLPAWLQPVWVDEVRAMVQGDTFRMILSDNIYPFRGRCLNAGCGEGLYDAFLRALPGMTAVANLDLPAAAPAGLAEYTSGSLTQLPFSNQNFDCCLASEVLEHIEDDRKAVSEIARVLKPGGMLLISVPTPPAPPDPAHVREGYTLSSLGALLEDAGFSLKRHAFCQHFWMRLFYQLWQWQFKVLGGGRASRLPRFIGRAFGYADKICRIGKPWDLVILAQKNH